MHIKANEVAGTMHEEFLICRPRWILILDVGLVDQLQRHSSFSISLPTSLWYCASMVPGRSNFVRGCFYAQYGIVDGALGVW